MKSEILRKRNSPGTAHACWSDRCPTRRELGVRAAPSSKVSANSIVEGPTLEDVAVLAALHEGWRRVRANKGGPGLDAITVQQFETGLEDRLLGLRSSLLDGSYRPSRLKRVSMPKADGGKRRLGIPVIADRIVQSAMLAVIGPGSTGI